MGGMDEINTLSEDIKTEGEIEHVRSFATAGVITDGKDVRVPEEWQPGGVKRYRERQENQPDGERMRSGKVARVGLRVHDVFGEFAEW